MTRVFVIGGGEHFPDRTQYLNFLREMKVDPAEVKPRGWKGNLQEDLGEHFEVHRISMPSPLNARYEEWEIWFEKYLPHMTEDVILVGHSLGALFLIKYLDEHDLAITVRGTFLVAAPFARTGDAELDDFSWDPKGYLMRFKKQAGQVYFYQGRDDEVVPYYHYESYRILVPSTPRLFMNRGHFIFDEHFPELVRDIKNLT